MLLISETPLHQTTSCSREYTGAGSKNARQIRCAPNLSLAIRALCYFWLFAHHLFLAVRASSIFGCSRIIYFWLFAHHLFLAVRAGGPPPTVCRLSVCFATERPHLDAEMVPPMLQQTGDSDVGEDGVTEGGWGDSPRVEPRHMACQVGLLVLGIVYLSLGFLMLSVHNRGCFLGHDMFLRWPRVRVRVRQGVSCALIPRNARRSRSAYRPPTPFAPHSGT